MSRAARGSWCLVLAALLASPARADAPDTTPGTLEHDASGAQPPRAPGAGAEVPASSTESSAREGRVSAMQLRRALQAYAGEPKVADLVAAALEASPADLDALEALAKRARRRGLAPGVRVSVRRAQGRGLSQQGVALDGTRLSTDADLVFKASLTFDLDRLVFADEEVALSREARARAKARAALARRVIALYFERRRLQLERDLLGVHDVAHAVRIAEIEAVLDVLSGGAFGRAMAGAGNRSRPPSQEGVEP